jgi:hypothetical protein
VLAESPSSSTEPVAHALGLSPLPDVSQYTEIFTFQLYPFASVYLGEEGMLGGEAGDRIAGFWRALGQTPPSESDHLSVMLALYAQLAELEERECDALQKTRWRTARKAFLWEHLLSWLPVYLSKMNEIAPPFFQRWSEVLHTALIEEAQTVGSQDQISLHLRESKGLVDPREREVEEFLQSLLTPARSGMILVRADLTRAAKRLGLGLRMGERKFIMKSLFSQDASGMLDWLIEEATEWTRRHSLNVDALGETATVWENKAASAGALLDALRVAK